MIRLFEHANFQGRELRRDYSDSTLVNNGFNDIITSAIVESGSYTLFEHVDYQGRSVTLTSNGGPNGNGLYPNSSTLGGLNDTFSSIRRNV